MEKSKKSYDWVLVFDIIILVLIGFYMVYSSSFPEGLYKFGDGFYFVKKQIVAGIAGIAVMIFLAYIPVEVYRKFSGLVLVICIGLSLLTVLAGTSGYGAQRWLVIAGVSFQPSEIIKIGAILFLADLMEKRRLKIKRLKEGFLVVMAFIALFVGIIAIQKDLSTSAILAGILLVMYFCAGARIIHIVFLGMVSVGGVIGLIALYPYRIQRMAVFLDPFADPKGAGWQIVQSLYALASGGLFGLGLGQSRQKFFYLPLPYNDFIFPIIGEELGFAGALLVILLFVVFAWRGVRISMNARNFYSSLVGIGLTANVMLQFLVHVGVTTSSLPPTGRALPFISAGGTSLFILLVSMGILLNISKNSKLEGN